MISLNSFLVGAVLASVASASALDPPPYDDPPYDPAYDQPYYPPPPARNSTHCYTIWEDGYRDYVPTYYETYVRESTSILTMTTAPVVVVTSTGLTATVTATATTTFETGDGTSTIPASAGFTPLASIVAAAGGSFNFANFAADPHITAAPKTDSAKNALSRKVDCRYYENCYPLEINCIIRSENIITATEIIVAGDPVTSTVIASAVATQTVTTTNTVTGSMAPHATAFQVCAANNVIPYFSPTAAWADAQFNGNLGVSAGADGTECCQLCALMGAVCQASAYTETTIGGSCAYFLSADANPVCVATTVAGIAEYQQGTTGNTYSFSNSNCGQLAVQAIT